MRLATVQKFGASSEKPAFQSDKTFFTKVKEELEFIPAQVKVLEYWREKAVFDNDGEDVIVAAQRPAHPLGECFAGPSLLAYIIASKYADGLPLHRLEGKRGSPPKPTWR